MPSNEPQSSVTVAPSQRRDISSFYIPVAIIVAGAIIGGSLYFALSTKSAAGPAGPGAEAQVEVDASKIDTSSAPYVGNANAPVTMIYWSDYQCPFCKKFEQGEMQQILTQYVNNGKVKLVFMDYPFLGQDSQVAAEYAHAVWELYPDKFFTWREAMFKAQDDEGDQGFGDAASIETLTKTIGGMDVAKVKAQVTKKKSDYDALISAEQQSGVQSGVQGTPGFVIGKQSVDGAQQLQVFVNAIEAELK